MRRAFLTLAVLASAFALGQGPTDHVVTAKRALILGEPRIAVGQQVQSYSTSPTGRYLVAVREVPSPAPVDLQRQFVPPPLGKQIVVWDSQTGQTKEIALSDETLLQTLKVDWFQGTDRAVVSLTYRNTSANPIVSGERRPVGATERPGMEGFLLDPAKASLQRLASTKREFGEDWSMNVSPVAPFAVKATTVFGKYGPDGLAMQTLSANGTWGPEVRLPKELVALGERGWSPDGLTFQAVVTQQTERLRPEKRVLLYSPTTGSYEIVNAPVAQFSPQVVESDVALSREVTALDEAAGPRSVLTWWIKSTTPTEQATVLVSEHAVHAVLPKGEKFVAYVFNGAVFTRQIFELDLKQFREARMAALKTEAISKAKQAVLAAIMYSSDHGDALPPGLDPMRDLLPYVRNSSVLEGFEMVFGGGSLLDVKDPANTVLGYIQTDYGRAVAYLDGHVKWETGNV
ncbi:MAG: hypothetical protein WD716_04500 [Fimbriimonadaceae bacterium]